MQNIVDYARQGKKDEFKTAIKEQLNNRRDSFLAAAKQAMLSSIGQKPK